jgi:hypothetical protein
MLDFQISPTPIAEPPPPYQLVDPAIATGSSASGNNRPTATVQLLPPALNATVPAPVVLPGAPAPQPGTSSSLPLIPGPPLQVCLKLNKNTLVDYSYEITNK